ncbi:hypothetical protein [Actinosynnema sp.]|uniref:hypothetical protein n=1 Tax=Actinosynnema sp. TaxID=1872144 RepID=UPI003F829B67
MARALVDKAAVPAEVLRGVSEVKSTVDEPPVRTPAPEVVGAVRELAHRERKAVVLSDAVEDALLDALRDAGQGDAGDGPALVTVEHLGRALLRLSGTRVAELLARDGFTAEQVRIGPAGAPPPRLRRLAGRPGRAGRHHRVRPAARRPRAGRAAPRARRGAQAGTAARQRRGRRPALLRRGRRRPARPRPHRPGLHGQAVPGRPEGGW